MHGFVRVKLGKTMMIGYYTVMLMHANLYCDKDLDRRYEEAVLSVSVMELQTYAVHISNDVKERGGGVITLR